MTPHTAIESMQRVEKLFGDKLHDNFMEQGWVAARNALEICTHFNFGAAAPEMAHAEFAADLVDQNLFRMPYPHMLMTGECSPGSGLLVVDELNNETKPFLCVITMSPFQVGEGGKAVLKLAAVPTMLTVLLPDEEEIRWTAVAGKGLQMNRKGEMLNEADIHDRSQRAYGLAVSWTALLMSKDVETVRVSAPDRLNLKRARQGRLAIRESMVVKIRAEARERQRQAALGYARNAPKMHWRRGHFRHLNEKHGGGIIPIAPQIINATEEAKPLKKQYQVR